MQSALRSSPHRPGSPRTATLKDCDFSSRPSRLARRGPDTHDRIANHSSGSEVIKRGHVRDEDVPRAIADRGPELGVTRLVFLLRRALECRAEAVGFEQNSDAALERQL